MPRAMLLFNVDILHQWIKLAIWVLCLTSINTLSVDTALPIMHFEPSSIETGNCLFYKGSHQFVIADFTANGSRYSATFPFTLQRLQL